MRNTLYISLFVFLFVLTSCNDNAQREKAQAQLAEIEELIQISKYNAAKIAIDSLHKQYPKIIDIRKKAIALEDTILRRECVRSIQFCDSIIGLQSVELDTLISEFRLEKDEKYQTVGNYVYKRLNTTNSERSYLRSYVDENADFFLVSNYFGPKINHTSITAASGDIYVETAEIPVGNAANHVFDNDGKHWELVTFKNDEGAKVAAFIGQNMYQLVKITLNGDKKHVYQLNEPDKKAIDATYYFWTIKHGIKKLEEEKRKAQVKIENIKQRDIKRQSDNSSENN